MQFVHPEAFLLLPLLMLWLRGRLWPHPLLGLVRVAVVLLVLTLFAEPYVTGDDHGRDVVVVVDGSRSMPDGEMALAQEFVYSVAGALGADDRLGLVRFGRGARVERAPTAGFRWPDAVHELDIDGSDLAGAIAAAAALVPPGRQGSILVWSDGEVTGESALVAAREAARRGLRVDTVLATRALGRDVAVVELSMPAQVAVGEPFAIGAVVAADEPGPATWQLSVDGEVVRRGEATLVAGRNVLQFQRRLPTGGEHELRFEVVRRGDARPENDRGIAAVRATAAPRLLCVTPGGRDDRLTRTLRLSGLAVDVVAPAAAPLTLAGLDAYRAVVLEDVPAADLPAGGMRALATWVKDLGGGLLMTGGRASFGVGGYHRSPVENVLPVTMEIRDEQRRFGLAMAIALDRSGSMRAEVGGETKMALADRGAATAIELLSAMDSVVVFAVDQAAHEVVPLQPVNDKKALGAMVRAIESEGGGIYVGEALHAAAAALARAPQQNRHLVLFADASDSEEPGDYRSFVPSLAAAGITVSVIGLGSDGDSDAALLREIASLGNGRCQFVANAAELPRVFAQETIQVARSSVVEATTKVLVRPGLDGLGDLPRDVPALGGYSIAWLRPAAEEALRADDEHRAPLLAHWQIGLGRAAACLAEVDGSLSGALATWPRYGDFFVTLARWLVGGQPPGVFVSARRQGAVGEITLEVDAARASSLDGARGVVTAPDGRAIDLVFVHAAPGRLVAHVPLLAAGVYRGAATIGGEVLRLPPLALPYSPEFAPQLDERAGERLLRDVARATGGSFAPMPRAVAAGPRDSLGAVALGAWFASAALLAMLGEILVRRFGWRLSHRSSSPAATVAATVHSASSASAIASAAGADTTPASDGTTAPDLLGTLAKARRRAERRS